MYIITVGSATPKIKSGCPPNIAWIIPQMAVDVRVSTALKVSSVSLFSCSPNAMTGSVEAKKMYAVGANILE